MKTTSYPPLSYFISLALKAGCITRQNFSLDMKYELKPDETPLTVTDTTINNLVLESFARDFPEVRVIGEEGSNTITDAKYTVLCDPVDGTRPFSIGLPVSTFCISLLEDRKPIIGVIYDPFQNRLWYAVKGRGAWIQTSAMFSDAMVGSHLQDQQKKVQVSKLATVNRSHVGMCWWKHADYHIDDVCRLLIDAGGHWINPCSQAIFGGLIASGTVDASIFPGKKGWETAAMQVLVEEAGGTATDIYGNPLVYGPNGEIEGHIMSNGLIHQELVNLVARCHGIP